MLRLSLERVPFLWVEIEMKTREEALEYGLSLSDTYQDAPFSDTNWQLVRYKGNKKAFRNTGISSDEERFLRYIE